MNLIIATSILLCALTSMEIDIFIPAFPQIMKNFNVNEFYVELTLGVNLFAHFIMAFFTGNLGDKYGRKPVIVGGLLTFIFGSAICLLSQNFYLLLFGRMIQGVGITGPSILSFTIIADLYDRKKQQTIMGILNGVATTSMAAAPVIGSYICKYFQWNGCFLLLMLLGIICLLQTALCLPNEIKTSKNSDNGISYKTILLSKKSMFYILTVCLLVLPYWSFTGISSIFYINALNVSMSNFGLYQASLATVFAIASFSSSYFLKKYGERRMINFGLKCLIIFVVLAIFSMIFNLKSPILITILVQVLSLGIIYPVNILYPVAISAIPEAKGKASALVGGIKFALIPCSLQIISYFYNGTIVPIFIVMVLVTTCCIFMVKSIYKQCNA